jgi:hypothetical protein
MFLTALQVLVEWLALRPRRHCWVAQAWFAMPVAVAGVDGQIGLVKVMRDWHHSLLQVRWPRESDCKRPTVARCLV